MLISSSKSQSLVNISCLYMVTHNTFTHNVYITMEVVLELYLRTQNMKNCKLLFELSIKQ